MCPARHVGLLELTLLVWKPLEPATKTGRRLAWVHTTCEVFYDNSVGAPPSPAHSPTHTANHRRRASRSLFSSRWARSRLQGSPWGTGSRRHTVSHFILPSQSGKYESRTLKFISVQGIYICCPTVKGDKMSQIKCVYSKQLVCSWHTGHHSCRKHIYLLF